MSRFDTNDDPRREFLIQALTAGLFASGPGLAFAQGSGIFGSRPARLPPGQSIYGLAGEVSVNERPADLSTSIKPGDTVQTGNNSEVTFVVNTHAMILRGNSKLLIETPPDTGGGAGSLIIGGLRMLAGKLLSVSRNSQMKLTTSTSTIGIRGTGFYIEADPELTYFCTCYGSTEVEAIADPSSKESVVAAHHDRPLYIVANGGTGNNIRSAPFLNHTDQELSLVETLVGRRVPFTFSNDSYTGPRRTY